MTPQQAVIAQLQSQGFRIDWTGKSIRMARGNDYRMIDQNGRQTRAFGAKR